MTQTGDCLTKPTHGRQTDSAPKCKRITSAHATEAALLALMEDQQ